MNEITLMDAIYRVYIFYNPKTTIQFSVMLYLILSFDNDRMFIQYY